MNESYMLHELKEGPLQICIFRNFIIESLFNNMYYINIYKCKKKKKMRIIWRIYIIVNI
ncbi:hypothetical protein PFFVO_01264 [Plasmodium falciparum Vietnam Oak-Knoll (FVO)]|uniref:Uncharacterized protein n=1 Tax=Plasmodium falciparum Vietnam Oak-Knoll (FVO) TaxID=1036723 RepID=A0A024VBF4_PLAFA|nr:hypothetical protein PFFVO_01264 [Plasmodium falciparum Vietnam Oak-Knoll (FVO)]